MLFSRNRYHRQIARSDRHLLVNGPTNLMVDSRGVVRPFGLTAPCAAPTAKALDKAGELVRFANYSYLYTYFDSYHDVESAPSPCTDFVGLVKIGTFSLVGFEKSSSGVPDFSKLIIAGDLEKEDGYYNNKSIAVHVINNDRKTEYSQWQYRKIIKYEWDSNQNAGIFTLSRPLINVDSDPEEREYEVKISDLEVEEGSVGGKSSGKTKLILDPAASSDIASYRLKVIRITSGKGKGQSRIIADACINASGLVEITLVKPWKTKPKFADTNDPAVQKAQEEWKGKDRVPNSYFNRWFSSEYMIYDPVRFSGLAIDGEVTSYDKKTGLIAIDGLGNGSAILSGQVVRFVQKTETDDKSDDDDKTYSSSSLVIALDNTNTADDWAESDGLIDKTIRITSGPGAGATFVISAVSKSGDNSISLTLSSTGYGEKNSEAFGLSGTPNAASTYVIFSDDPVSLPDLTIGSLVDKDITPLYPSSYFFNLSTAKNSDSASLSDNFVPRSCWNPDSNKNATVKTPGGGSVSVVCPKHSIGFIIRDPNVISLLRSKVTATTNITDYSFSCSRKRYKKNLVNFVGEGFVSNIISTYPELKPSSDPSADPSYLVVFFSNKCNGGVNSSFESFFFPGGTYCGDNRAVIGSLYISIPDPSNKYTFAPVGDDDDPGFKIYLSSLDDLGLLIDSFVPGAYSFTFTVAPYRPEDIAGEGASEKKIAKIEKKYSYKITRPIIGIVEASTSEPAHVIVSGTLPTLYVGSNPEAYLLAPSFGTPATVVGNSLMEGFYTGWKAFFYNDDLEAKPKQKFKEARVAGYFDATGSILLDTKLSGVGPGWSCVLYSEYSKCLGSAIAPYDTDTFYAKKAKPIKAYSDFVPLEAFASSQDTDADGFATYEGWTLQALSSSKLRKNGSSKYKVVSSKKAEKRKRTIVKYFPKSRRAYVFYKEDDSTFPPDESQMFSPALDGSEHLWLYDESSGIDALFNEDDDSNSSEDKTSDYGCRILVSDIRPSSLAGVDKIRLYRASDLSKTYLHVVTLDNKLQSYEDNVPDPFLGKEIDFATVPPPPAGVCTYFKGCFVLGGVPDSVNLNSSSSANPVVSVVPSSYYALAQYDYQKPIFEGYCYTDGGTFRSTVLKIVPAFKSSVRPSVRYEVPFGEKLSVEELNFSLLISSPGTEGLILYATQDVFSGRTQPSPVVKGPNDDCIYLPRSASSSNSAYTGCRFVVTNGDKRFAYVVRENHYTGSSRCLDEVNIASVLPSSSGLTRYPSFPFTIDKLLWSLKYSGGKYVLTDSEGSREITPSTIDGPDGTVYLSFGATVHQGTNFSAVNLYLGGSLDGSSVLGESALFSLVALSFANVNDELIESYLPSVGKLLEKRSDSGLVMQIPGSISNQVNLSVYTDSESTPFTRNPVSSGDIIWRLILFDKFSSSYNAPATISLTPRDNGYVVYACSERDNASEKTELSNAFTFADDYGERITGLVPSDKFVAVFKDRAIYALDTVTPSITCLNREVGCIAPDSIATGRSGVYWLSADRRVLRSTFSEQHPIYYASKEIQPWLDGNPAFDGEFFDESRIREVKATYDADTDEYVIAFPTKSGKWLLFAFSDTTQYWFRIYDHSGTDELCSENAFNCLFKNNGRASYASDHGVYSYSEGYRPSFYPWKYASTYLSESNSGIRKHVKRIQVINLVDKNLPAAPVPCAYFEFYRDLLDAPEESYQNEDRHTRRFFDTNKFVQFVHVGLRSLLWNFKMFSSDQEKVSNANFVRIHDFSLHYRHKREDDPRWNDTPYTDPPIRTT